MSFGVLGCVGANRGWAWPGGARVVATGAGRFNSVAICLGRSRLNGSSNGLRVRGHKLFFASLSLLESRRCDAVA